MDSPVSGEVTLLLSAWRSGEQNALHRLVDILHPQLRLLAHRSMRKQAGLHTLQTTGLLHEAFLKLAQSGGVATHDRAHFLALCARIMRSILVDEARARLALKRGGAALRVEFDDNLQAGGVPSAGVLRLHDALNALAKVDPRKSKIIELRFFGGLSVEESAEALGISRETALRDWRFGRAWLQSEMESEVRNG